MLLLFFMLFFPALLYFGKFKDQVPDVIAGKIKVYGFPDIWETLGYSGNWTIFFFLAALVIYTITIEVSNKTMRQSIINGLSREEFFLSKVINVVLLSFLITIFYSTLSLIVGIKNSTDFTWSMAFDNNWAGTRFFLMSMGYLSFALLFAFIFRKAGLAVFAFFAYTLIEQIFKLYLGRKISQELANYLPFNVIEDLHPNPLSKLASGFTEGVSILPHSHAMLFSLIYSILALAAAYWIFKKGDL